MGHIAKGVGCALKGGGAVDKGEGEGGEGLGARMGGVWAMEGGQGAMIRRYVRDGEGRAAAVVARGGRLIPPPIPTPAQVPGARAGSVSSSNVSYRYPIDIEYQRSWL